MSNILDKKVYVDIDTSQLGGIKIYYSKILTQICSKIINIPILKHHETAGITFCLKSVAYGMTNSRYHPENCIPFIPLACKHRIVKEKVILNIGDAICGIFDKGPVLRNRKYRFMPKSIFFSTDMVACDKIALDLLENERKQKGINSTWKEYGKPEHIKAAAEMGLGNYSNIIHRIVK